MHLATQPGCCCLQAALADLTRFLGLCRHTCAWCVLLGRVLHEEVMVEDTVLLPPEAGAADEGAHALPLLCHASCYSNALPS